MKVTIIGSGHVGLVTGACFAERSHDVLCVDSDEDKIGRLREGVMPFFEPGLGDLHQGEPRLGAIGDEQ